MKNTSIFLLSLLFLQSAWAGLAPTNVNSQSGTSLKTHSNITVRASQATNLGGLGALLEGSSRNLLANPSFEHVTFNTGWTATKLSGTTFTCSQDTTNFIDGAASSSCSTTSATGEFSNDVTPSPAIQTVSVPMIAACWVKTTATDVQICSRTGGTDAQNCQSVVSNGNWVYAFQQFTGPSNGTSVGVSVKNTVSGSESFNVDDCSVSPLFSTQVTGVQASDSSTTQYSFTPNSGAFGSILNPKYTTWRIGDRLYFSIQFTNGTVSTGVASIAMPTGLTIDNSKAGATLATVMGHVNLVAGTNSLWVAGIGGVVFYDGSDTANLYIASAAATNTTLTKATGSGMSSSGQTWEIVGSVPILGWSSQQNIQTAQTYNISSYLAAGSRVTGSAPTSLGQYRSYLRNAGALTFTETNGNPTTTPTTADGVKVYTSATKASADASNSPSKYDIFVGKNMNVQWQFYASAGKTGFVETKPYVDGSANGFGYDTNYDPTTGVATIVKYVQVATSLFAGIDSDGGTAISGPIYFDIKVAPNAIALGTSPMTVQRFTSGSGTYTTPANVRWIEVEMCGGGGGGGAAITNGGTNGNDTTFGSSLLTAAKGLAGAAGGNSTQAGGAGGAATVNSPAIIMTAVSGQDGGPNSLATTVIGGIGGASFLGGAGQGGQSGGAAGGDAKTNSCSGGGGGKSSTGATVPGTGGGAGAYIHALISNPSATYSYAVGAKGTGGAAGTFKGGDGADGMIVVREYYQ